MTATGSDHMGGRVVNSQGAGAAALHWPRDAGQSARWRCFVVVVVRSFVQPIKCSAHTVRAQNANNGKPCANLDIGSN